MLRTCLHTNTTANTLILIDHSKTIMNKDCFLRADSCTITMAKTTICTCAVAGKHEADSLTCVNTIIDQFLTCIGASTVTLYKRNLSDHLTCCFAQDCCTFFCNIRTTRRTKTDFCCAGSKCCCITITTRETAGTTVCTRKCFSDCCLFFINRYCKLNGSP